MLIPVSLSQAILPGHYRILRQVKKELKVLLCIQFDLFVRDVVFPYLYAVAFPVFLMLPVLWVVPDRSVLESNNSVVLLGVVPRDLVEL